MSQPKPPASFEDKTVAARKKGAPVPLEEAPAGAPMVMAAPLKGDDGPYPRGTPLGRYLVLECIGEGGMGRVYACFDPQLDRRVALKLILADGMDKSQQRLLREARAMAKLSHRNVVAVHDVGTVGDRVFVAMEYVEGATLRDWLAIKKRELPDILQVFRHAARGLAAAHEKGLVHRDFKPENVLVATNGRVCVTDFGLARSMENRDVTNPHGTPDAATSAPLTQVGMAIGTPRYMAPEQLRGKKVDGRSDEFAFAVTLWEALYEQHPFDPGDNKDEELLSRVLNGEIIDPPRGAGVPGWLNRALRKGMSVDADKRLGGLQAWARLLARPVRARSSWLAMGAGSLIAVGAFAVGGRWLAGERNRLCEGAAAQLESSWSGPIRQELSTALQQHGALGTEAWVKAEAALEAWAGRWRETHREVCAASGGARLRIDEGLKQRIGCLGQSAGELGALAQILKASDRESALNAVTAALSLPSPERCLQSATQAWTAALDDDQKTFHTQAQQRLSHASVQHSSGQFEEAEAQALAVAEEARKKKVIRDMGRAWLQVASARAAMSQLEGANEAILFALLSGEAEGDTALVAQAWAERAALDVSLRGRPEAALEWIQHARATLGQSTGDARLETRLQSLAGAALIALGRDTEALAALEKTAALEEKATGESLSLARALTELGNALRANDRASEAMDAHERALRIRKTLLPPNDAQLASSHNGLGLALLSQGKPPEALEEHRRAEALLEAVWQGPHLERVQTLSFIAQAQRSAGNTSQASATLEKALTMAQALLKPEHPARVALERELGRALLNLNRPGPAAEHLARAVDDGPPDNIERATLLAELAEAELTRRRPAEAARRASAALALRPKDGWVRFTLARALKELGDARWTREGEVALGDLQLAVDRRSEKVQAWLPTKKKR
jgi:eukaryotic-like serine/threonine-protein kinase